MSMNPGLTIFPAASMVAADCSGENVPMARMVSPTIPRSAVQVGPPVPSRMVPFRITRSNLDSASILDVGNREKPTAADAPVVMNCRRVRLAGMAVLLSQFGRERTRKRYNGQDIDTKTTAYTAVLISATA